MTIAVTDIQDLNVSPSRDWETKKLRDVTCPTRSRSNPAEYPNLPFVGMEHVEAHTTKLLKTVAASEMKSSAVHFMPGDVLYGRLRPYLNKVISVDFEGLCSGEFIVLPSNGDIDASFLKYFLNSADFVRFAASLNTGDRPRVDFGQIGEREIPIPPLDEQKEIVAAIETQFARLDDAVAALERARARLKRYRASVLKAACEGRLVPTEAELARQENRPYEPASELLARIKAARPAPTAKGKRKSVGAHCNASAADQPPLPEGWTWTNVDQLTDVVRGASPRPAGDPRYFGGTIPWITVGSLTAGESPYLTTTTDFVTEEGRARSRYIEPGTLLLTNSGATLGVPRITLIGGCINDGSVALIDIQDETLKLYLHYYLKTQTRRLRGINQGAAQPNLNTGLVRQIPVPLPPSDEQQRIVGEIDRRLSTLDRMETEVTANLKRAESLRQSILRRAFKGELS